jgi:hypothetical protein
VSEGEEVRETKGVEGERRREERVRGEGGEGKVEHLLACTIVADVA